MRQIPTYQRNSSESARNYMPQLDALRAVAVGAVIAHHFLGLDRFIPYGFITPGELGVRLFFVLSGFLITSILLKCRPEFHSDDEPPLAKLRKFYMRRFLRIFPVYYLTLALIVVLNVPTARATIFWHLSYLSNVYFSQPGTFDGPLTHFWSLAVEEQFYVAWPLFMIFAPEKYLRPIIITTIVVAPLFRLILFVFSGNQLATQLLPFGCMDSLGLGALLGYYAAEKGIEQNKRSFLRFSFWAGVLLLAFLVILYLLGRGQWLSVMAVYLAVSFLFVWLVARAATGFTGVAGRLLEARPIVYVGRISYGIYIFHNFMPVIVPKIFAIIGLTYPSGRGATFKRFVILGTAALVCAALSWHFFEGPINNLKRYFRYNKTKPLKDKNHVGSMETVLNSP